MDGLIAFAQENLVLIIVAVIAVILIISLVKTVLKWVIVAVIIIGILVYGFNYDVSTLKEVGEKVLNYTKDEAVQLLIGDTELAQYEQYSDGTFSIFGKNMRLDGSNHSDELKLYIFGQTFNLKLDDKLQKFIEEVKSK